MHTCLICGKKCIAEIRPHLKSHNMTIQEYEEQFGIVAPTFRLPRHKATEEEKMHYAIMSDYSRKKLVQTARKM